MRKYEKPSKERNEKIAAMVKEKGIRATEIQYGFAKGTLYTLIKRHNNT